MRRKVETEFQRDYDFSVPSDERFYGAELHRLKGELLLQQKVSTKPTTARKRAKRRRPSPLAEERA